MHLDGCLMACSYMVSESLLGVSCAGTHQKMALLAWLVVSAVMSLLVPGTAAQSRCMVTVKIPNTQPGAGVSQATINMVRASTSCPLIYQSGIPTIACDFRHRRVISLLCQ